MMAHSIRRLSPVNDAQVHGLAELLIDCVAGGASVMLHASAAAAKGRGFLAARGRRGGSGRTGVSKMLVHRRARRRGLGAALLLAAESVAGDPGVRSAAARHRTLD